MKRPKLAFEALERRDLLAADPIITEFMASNDATIVDGNGEYSDWIEIYNNGDQSVDLGGYGLTDDAADLNKWQFPSTVLEPREFLVVFASGTAVADPAGNLHTNFRLSANGEYVALSNTNGSILSEFGPGGSDYPAQLIDSSYGLAFDTSPAGSVNPNSAARLIVPSNGADDGVWFNNGFDDSAWQLGTASIGYEDSPADYQGLIQTTVPSGTTSVYIRIPFTTTDNGTLTTLQMKYDDGFIAYINGTRVAGANDPAVGSYDSTATDDHPDDQAVNYVDFNVSQYSYLLTPGANTLAIHLMNRNSGSSDLLSVPNMTVSTADLIDPPLIGVMSAATPGQPNTQIKAADVDFSRIGGVFEGNFVLTMSSQDASATIRYTTNGSPPQPNSQIYTSPITVSATTQFRARTFGLNGETGDITTEAFTRVDATTASFTSDLPIVVLENFEQGVPGRGWQDAALALYESDATGRSALVNDSTVTSRIGMHRRGSSTFGNPKTNYRIELRDQNGQDQSQSLLGMPAESDWILYAPYNFDRALLRNTLIYDLSEQMGQYSIRTRFVEVYSNTSDAELNDGDYMGVYVLMENVKRDAERVAIEELTPADNAAPEVTGGYIIKIDRPDGSADGAWHSSRGTPSIYNENSYVHVEPERSQMTQPQVDYIRGYFEDFEDALYGPNSTDPVLGYEAYFDVDKSIDHHLLRTLSKDPDALRLSEYLYKDREGKLTFGPLWDVDRAMGPDDDGRASNPIGWNANEADFFGYDWWGELFDDPNFTQRWVDRWQELRQTVLSDANIDATTNGMAVEIAEAQARNFARWPNVSPNGGAYAEPGLSGWEAEVSHLAGWVKTRAAWMDEQMVSSPILSPQSGNVPADTQVTLSATPETTIYYTLDGSDPRADGGAISPNAIEYTGAITVTQTTTINARAYGSAGTDSGVSNSSYPAGESPSDGIDSNANTKYLNFGEENSGLIVTPNFGSSTVRSMRFTTANDAEERDPTSWELYGTNDSIASLDNSTGTAENWTLIDAGTVNLPSARRTDGPTLTVSNSTQYSSYKLMFPTVKNSGAANSMQVADIRFFQSTNGTGTQILSAADDARAVHVETFLSDGLTLWSRMETGVYSIETPADSNSLRITELHYHPADPTAAELAAAPATIDNDYEFVELFNASGNTISLNGVQFADGVSFDLTTGAVNSLAPGAAVLVVSNLTAFQARYGSSLPVAGEYAANLANGGERIIVLDSLGNTIHNFIYDDASPWPTAADGDGPAMEVIDIFGNYSDAFNWRSTAPNGTPGAVTNVLGDFNSDGQLTCADINLLNAESVAGTNDLQFDVNSDGLVNLADVQLWVTGLRGTLLGDANLDGVVDVSDFGIWNGNKFTSTTEWCRGDFNSDGVVDVSDLIVWNANKFQFAARAELDTAARRVQRKEGDISDRSEVTNEIAVPKLPQAAVAKLPARYVDDYFATRQHDRRSSLESLDLEPLKIDLTQRPLV